METLNTPIEGHNWNDAIIYGFTGILINVHILRYRENDLVITSSTWKRPTLCELRVFAGPATLADYFPTLQATETSTNKDQRGGSFADGAVRSVLSNLEAPFTLSPCL